MSTHNLKFFQKKGTTIGKIYDIMEKTGKESGKMESKDKIVQIYEIIADIALFHLNKNKKANTIPDEFTMSMVSATLQLHNSIACNQKPDLFQD